MLCLLSYSHHAPRPTAERWDNGRNGVYPVTPDDGAPKALGSAPRQAVRSTLRSSAKRNIRAMLAKMALMGVEPGD